MMDLGAWTFRVSYRVHKVNERHVRSGCVQLVLQMETEKENESVDSSVDKRGHAPRKAKEADTKRGATGRSEEVSCEVAQACCKVIEGLIRRRIANRQVWCGGTRRHVRCKY